MSKKSQRVASRATGGKVMVGLSAVGALGGAAALAAPPAWAVAVAGNCHGIATCAMQGQPRAGSTTGGPQLAPLPTALLAARSLPSIPDRPITSIVATGGGGYRLTGSSGGVYSFGDPDTANILGQKLNGRIVGAAQTKSGGIWLAGSDGGVFAINAPFYGSAASQQLNGSIVAAASSPVSGGYLLAASDGGVFAYDAPFYGSAAGQKLNAGIVGMAVDPLTGGYWLVGSDGGVFAFNAPFFGSLAGRTLGARIVGIAASPTGDGYWLVGADGGVFNFGDAHFFGSLGGHALGGAVVGMAATPTGGGYWLAGSDGGIFTFGDAAYLGNALALPPPPPPPPPPAPAPVNASGVAPGGVTGMDISQYQCADIPPGRFGIAVVQVSGGIFDGAPNPCYTAEAAWAGPNMEAYIYMNGVPFPAPAAALAGPLGVCHGDAPCIGFNFGWNMAQRWVAYSKSVGVHPRKWWLDVEKDSGWTDQGTNRLVIQGAVYALQTDHLSVGIYSTSTQWNAITGGMTLPRVELWVPGAGSLTGAGYTATQFCSDPSQAFAGGRIKYVQYGYTGGFPGAYPPPAPAYDLDYAC